MDTLKNFLGSTPGVITVAICAVLLLCLLILVPILTWRLLTLIKAYDTSKAKAAQAAKEADELTLALQTSNRQLSERVNELTNENKLLKDSQNQKESARFEELNAKADALEKENSALKEELSACKKQEASRKKAKPKKPTVKLYSKETLESMTKHELMTLAKTNGYMGFYHKSKDQVIEHILACQDKKAKK